VPVIIKSAWDKPWMYWSWYVEYIEVCFVNVRFSLNINSGTRNILIFGFNMNRYWFFPTAVAKAVLIREMDVAFIEIKSIEIQ